MRIKNYSLVEKLEKSGFSDKEARIYVALLEMGGAYPSKVAEYTDLNRSTVYHILTALTIRGLISEIEKRNKIFYQIEKPEKIVRFGETRIRIAEDELDHIKSVLPDIQALFQSLGDHPKVSYYENTEGIEAIYSDMIAYDHKYEMLAWSNAAELENVIPSKFFERFRQVKQRIGITTRGIIPDSESDRTYNDRFFKGYKPEIVPKMRYINKDIFPFKGEITIYGENKVAIVNLDKQYLTGTIIEDKTIHDMLKLIFELSWNSNMVKK